MPLMIINAQNQEGTERQIKELINEFEPEKKSDNNVGLIIDGHVSSLWEICGCLYFRLFYFIT